MLGSELVEKECGCTLVKGQKQFSTDYSADICSHCDSLSRVMNLI